MLSLGRLAQRWIASQGYGRPDAVGAERDLPRRARVVLRPSAAEHRFLAFLIPTVFGLLANSQHWFHTPQPRVDIQFAQAGLFVFAHALTGQEWAHIAITGVTWLLIPLLIGLRLVMRSEVK
jgi:hypothetical protein